MFTTRDNAPGVGRGRLFSRQNGRKFHKEYIILAQSVYDDFGLDIPPINYTARRWRRIVIQRSSGGMFTETLDDSCLLLNMRECCDISKVNFLGIRCSKLPSIIPRVVLKI